MTHYLLITFLVIGLLSLGTYKQICPEDEKDFRKKEFLEFWKNIFYYLAVTLFISSIFLAI